MFLEAFSPHDLLCEVPLTQRLLLLAMATLASSKAMVTPARGPLEQDPFESEPPMALSSSEPTLGQLPALFQSWRVGCLLWMLVYTMGLCELDTAGRNASLPGFQETGQFKDTTRKSSLTLSLRATASRCG